MIEAILFDLDGTMWDSTDYICDIWNKVFSKHDDISYVMKKDELMQLMGKTMEETWKLVLPDFSKEAWDGIVAEFVLEEVSYLSKHGAILYEGLEDTLNKLHKEYKLFIVSNCQEGYVPAFMHAHKLEKYFDDYEVNGRTGLNKGDNIKLIMQRNHIQNAVYVGDTDGDEKASRIAGIPFIHAAYGFGTADKPDAVITKLTELPECIKNF